jgi:hypothetical protein
MASIWDGSPQAGQFAATPSGLGALFARLERMERLLRELTGADILSAADVLVSKEGLSIAGELLVTGNMRVQGTLSLPAGIIDNDALAAPVVPVPFNFTAGPFGTTGGMWESKATLALPTPAGFSRAVVLANAGVTLTNTQASTTSQLVGRTGIYGATGFLSYGPLLVPNGTGSAASTATRLVTGLTPGAPVNIESQVWTGNSWASSPSNVAGVNGVVLWLR